MGFLAPYATNENMYYLLIATFVVVVILLVLFVVQWGVLAKKSTMGQGGSDITKFLSGSVNNKFATESGNQVYQVAKSAFTGGYSPDTPSFWESPLDRVEYAEGSGLGGATANAFAGTEWADFEKAVYPKLTSQLQARYTNASTAEKVNILTGAGMSLGLKPPAVAATTSGMDNRDRLKTSRSTLDDPAYKLLGL